MVVPRGSGVHREDVGYQNRASGVTMTDSTLFRIYSMSKPITSVAISATPFSGLFRVSAI